MSSICAMRIVITGSELGIPRMRTETFDPQSGLAWADDKNPKPMIRLSVISEHWWRSSDTEKKHPIDFGKAVSVPFDIGTDEVFIVYDANKPKQTESALLAQEAICSAFAEIARTAHEHLGFVTT